MAKVKFSDLVYDEPYRAFFPLGIFAGIWGAAYWIVVMQYGLLSYAPIYHGLLEIEVFGGAFAIGFLLTALPRFTQSPPVPRAALRTLFLLFVVFATLLILGNFWWAQLNFVILMLTVILVAIVGNRRGTAFPPASFPLIGFGLLSGVLGAALQLTSDVAWNIFGRMILEEGMFLFLVLGVGSFLGPRLMGNRSFEGTPAQSPGKAAPQGDKPQRYLPYLIAGLTLCFGYAFEGLGFLFAGRALRSVIVIAILAQSRVLFFPKKATIIGISLWISAYALVIWAIAHPIVRADLQSVMHILYVAGFAQMIFLIGTQVTLSHSGYPEKWRSYRFLWGSISALIFLAAGIRVAAGHYPEEFSVLITTAASMMSIALLLWFIGISPFFRQNTLSR